MCVVKVCSVQWTHSVLYFAHACAKLFHCIQTGVFSASWTQLIFWDPHTLHRGHLTDFHNHLHTPEYTKTVALSHTRYTTLLSLPLHNTVWTNTRCNEQHFHTLPLHNTLSHTHTHTFTAQHIFTHIHQPYAHFHSTTHFHCTPSTRTLSLHNTPDHPYVQ